MRTRQTLAELQDLWPEASILFIDELYLASRQEILSEICALQTSGEMLVVGHNDGLSDLVMNLAHPPHALKTCGFISMDFPFESSAYISQDTGSILAKFRVL